MVIAAVAVASAVGSCSDPQTSAADESPSPSAHGVAPLSASALAAAPAPHAWDVVHALQRAGLAVPNALETTAQECPAAGCDQAVVTDTLRVKSFATAPLAVRYAAARGLDHAGTVVMSFAPPVAPSERARYWQEIQKLIRKSP